VPAIATDPVRRADRTRDTAADIAMGRLHLGAPQSARAENLAIPATAAARLRAVGGAESRASAVPVASRGSRPRARVLVVPPRPIGTQQNNDFAASLGPRPREARL